jgi:hypothetical protein
MEAAKAQNWPVEPQGKIYEKSIPEVLPLSFDTFCISTCVFPFVARQRLGQNFTAETNTHATIEELLDTSFPMRYVSY